MGISIIWDIDGTLFDTYPSFAKAYLLALRGSGIAALPAAAEVQLLARVSLSHCAGELASRFGLDPEGFAERFSGIYGSIPPARQGPYPGAREVCELIVREGGLNAVATHRGRASAERLLSAHGLRHLFADIASVEDGFPKKPDPAMFLSILKRQGLEPARSVAVGDRDIDVLAGKAAGIRTCLFRGEPETSGPDFAFEEYSELFRYLAEG